ncbi:MAG: hypothetical protein ACR2NZ_05955 [Rubripirellula sp.]
MSPCMMRTLAWLPVCLIAFTLCTPSWSQETQSPVSVDIDHELEMLSSRRFGERQHAIHQLASLGADGIELVESQAGRRDVDYSTCCVAILVQIGQDDETREAAIDALERLAKDDTFLSSKFAAKQAFLLKESHQERAVRLLTAEGVRMHRTTSTGEVRSVSGIQHDRQCALLKYFPVVASVSVSGNDVTNRALLAMAKSESIESVTIMRTSITNIGLQALADIPNLTRVSLAGKFDSTGFQQLKKIPKLSSIAVFDSITEEQLQVLCDLKLRTLYLSDIPMSENVPKLLRSLSNLASLYVTLSDVQNNDLSWVKHSKARSLSLTLNQSPRFNDEGLRVLADSKVSRLSLRDTGITDAGLAILAQYPALSSLSISNAPITDRSLLQLTKQKSLTSLTLRETDVTEEGLKTLRQKMPKLRYTRNTPRAIPNQPAPPKAAIPKATPNKPAEKDAVTGDDQSVKDPATSKKNETEEVKAKGDTKAAVEVPAVPTPSP